MLRCSARPVARPSYAGYDKNKTVVIVAFDAALFHLFNYAMAKGMLFMASGSVIHEMHAPRRAPPRPPRRGRTPRSRRPSRRLRRAVMANMGGLASRLPHHGHGDTGRFCLDRWTASSVASGQGGIIANRVAVELMRFLLPAPRVSPPAWWLLHVAHVVHDLRGQAQDRGGGSRSRAHAVDAHPLLVLIPMALVASSSRP